ncbi:hypothetical protein [Sphingopyxis sp. H115]|uniref:hypothetical protein n=1 Tax=Sphingopyxis sp. H115 TaxID=1759073 RepID=UPI000737651C|nr:hypothetical protein [Sphingopyxis sp. H115]KTE08924.1 hypothetical protein ATE71_13465 [Sphingopyxis sp. H115]
MILQLTLMCFVGGSTAAEPKVEQKTILPQPDQVSFFERPITLAAARRSDVPSPLVILLDRDPWAAVIGSDSPTFALYEEGTVIQKAANGFTATRLTDQELKYFLDRLNLPALSRFYGRFEAENATDQPTQDLLVYRAERPVFVSVYGSLKDSNVRAKIPKEVTAAYDMLTQFQHPKSRAWLPKNIEVMIWPYKNAPGLSVRWPPEWPGLSDPKTIRRGDSFSIFMPSLQLAELRAFLKRRKEKGAVEIDDEKWAASIRFPFPHEKLWMAPHPELK